MVAGGLAALALRWKVIAKSFQGLGGKDVDAGGDFPIRWVAWGAALCTIVLAAVQKISLGFPIWLSLVSVFLSIILMLVGIRVLGETNWAPISAMANVMQAVFAVLAPGHVPINMIGSGMSGTVAANGEHLMQDFRAGKIVGSTNRNLTVLQLIGVPVGALAVAVAYPLVRAKYGIGGEHGLSSPISVKWAGFAELLSKGFAALPQKRALGARYRLRRRRRADLARGASQAGRLRALAHRRRPRHAHPRFRRHPHGGGRHHPGAVEAPLPEDRGGLRHPARLRLHHRRGAGTAVPRRAGVQINVRQDARPPLGCSTRRRIC
jgi:hypothetical protein